MDAHGLPDARPHGRCRGRAVVSRVGAVVRRIIGRYGIAIVLGAFIGAMVAIKHKGYLVLPVEKPAGAFSVPAPHDGSAQNRGRDAAPLHRETGGFQ